MNFRALGGHCGNQHRGENFLFSQKKETRDKRTLEREALRSAKNLYI